MKETRRLRDINDDEKIVGERFDGIRAMTARITRQNRANARTDIHAIC